RYLEETWIHRPLTSLTQVPPVDAAGHPGLKKKLSGVIQFLQECAAMAHYPCDFDRLRRKLGLAQAAASTTGAAVDVSALSAAELAALPRDALSDAQAEEAYQAAVRLDARDLAGKFAAALATR